MTELETQIDADVRKLLTEIYNQWKDQLYVNSHGILCCRRKPSEKVYDHDALVLPQRLHAEMLYRAHDDQGHQALDRLIARIRQRLILPGLNRSVRRWVKVCRLCQNANTPSGGKTFPVKNIVSGSLLLRKHAST